jgi:hypothetical protein
VFLAGTTTAASIYTTSTSATAVNSVTTDSSDGSFTFYVDNADYDTAQKFDITFLASGFQDRTWSSVTIFPVPSYKDFTSVSSSSTGEDDLISIDVPAGTLGVNGGVRITAAGTKTNSNGNKTIKLYWGTAAWTFNVAANDTNDWRVQAEIFNVADIAVQRATWLGFNGATPLNGYETATEDTASAVTIKCTGECANGSDVITQTMMLVELI